MTKILKLLAFSFLTLLLRENAEANCTYENDYGAVIQVREISKVPAHLQKYAYCTGETEKEKFILKSSEQAQTSSNLAAPDEIALEGSIRSESISTPLGEIELRWPRQVEGIFGRTPLRATSDAARTVSRAIRTAAFPSKIQNINLPWKIIFINQDQLSENIIPPYLRENCHPGWMTTPANIYIVAERVAYNCSNKKTPPSEADRAMTQVLVHEMGHALEFHMLGARNGDPDERMRAEGFASWFEHYAAEYSSLLSRSKIKDDFLSRAKFSLNQQPENFSFSGSSLDYARASMYFFSISDKRGNRGVMDIYKEMRENRTTFFPAIKNALGWNRDRLERETRKFIEAN